jgi:hypothetical protein
MHPLIELTQVLGEEVRVGEDLLHNLESQKKALLTWDSATLLEQIEEKEQLVRQLSAIDERRQAVMPQLLHAYGLSSPDALSLSAVLAQLPAGTQLHTLTTLQRRAWEIYSRLRAEEKRLAHLMNTLLGYLREAIGTFSRPAGTVYGGRGTVIPLRTTSGLMQGRV